MVTIVKEFRDMVTDIFIDSEDIVELESESDAVNIANWLNQSEAEIITSDSGITKFTSYVIFSDIHECIEREDLGFSWANMLKRRTA